MVPSGINPEGYRIRVKEFDFNEVAKEVEVSIYLGDSWPESHEVLSASQV